MNITYDELKILMYSEMTLEHRLLYLGHELTVDVISCTPYKTVEERARRWQRQLSKILWPMPRTKVVIPENVQDILKKGIPIVKYMIKQPYEMHLPPMVRARKWLEDMKVEF